MDPFIRSRREAKIIQKFDKTWVLGQLLTISLYKIPPFSVHFFKKILPFASVFVRIYSMNKHIVSSLMLVSCSLYAVESRVEIRHREAAGVGYSMGYSSLDYFLMTEHDVEFLLDARAHIFNNGQGAGNFGLGFRCPVHDEKYLVGANAFYDIRQSNHLLANQVGAGFEWLGKYVDFRTNGCIPVGKKQNITYEEKEFAGFSGSHAYKSWRMKSSLPCIDAEVGTPLPHPFYFGIGGYYLFKQSKSSIEVGNAFGAKARAEVDLGRYVTLGFAITYDHIFKTRPQGYLSINIPFESKRSRKNRDDDLYHTEKERNLRRVPIVRNEIIPIQSKRKSHDPLTGKDGDPIRFFFVNNLAAPDGDGSFERPFAALKDAERHSQPGDVIYVFPGDHTARNMDEGIVLKDKQILASPGAPLILNDVVIPKSGDKPIIFNITESEPAVTNPAKNRIDDFFLIPPWEYIFARGVEPDHYADARDAGFEVVDP